jgi:hypothetical protein
MGGLWRFNIGENDLHYFADQSAVKEIRHEER